MGGEIYVKKIPSMNIMDIADAVAPGREKNIIGIRPGEKLHEQMIGAEDAPHTYEYSNYYKIIPAIHNWSKDPIRIKEGKPVKYGFTYSSQNNSEWMTQTELASWLERNLDIVGKL